MGRRLQARAGGHGPQTEDRPERLPGGPSVTVGPDARHSAPRPQGQPGQEQVSTGLKALREGTATNADSAQRLKPEVRPLLPGPGTQGLPVRGARGPVRGSACLGGASAHCPQAGTCRPRVGLSHPA